MNVLLIEDSRAEARLIEEMLKTEAGATLNLEWVDRLSAGLEHLSSKDVDVVLLDLSLPDSRGFDTFTKAYEKAQQVPMIVLSGLDDEEMAIRAVREGAQDYLVKGEVDGSLLMRAMRYAIERKHTEEQLARRARELAALNKTNQAIASTLNRDAILELVMSEAQAMLNAEAASVLLHDTTSDELVFAATVGPHSDKITGTRIPTSEGIAGWVFREGQPALVDGAARDDRFYNQIDQQTGLTTDSLLAVPMTYKERVIGVIETLNKAEGPFNTHDLYLLTTLAASAAAAIENARLIEAEREQRRLVQQSQNQLVQSEKLAATGRLAASMAHEINNPLQAIHNSLQLMLAFPLEPEEQTEYLEMADEEVERLIGMVGRILDFARRPQRDMRSTDLNDVIKKVLTLSDRFLQHRNIALRKSLNPDLPPVSAVPGELGQVFLNLLLNAVDAMPEGGELHVSSSQTGDGQIAISFTDTGHGIEPEDVARIFEPFFSTKEGGTGLGLAVSYNVIERHNGEITVESATGEGATFTVWLPAVSE